MIALLLWLFGVSAWGAACNLPAWARLLAERWRERVMPRRRDLYLWMRLGMVAGAVGIAGGSWTRASFIYVQPAKLLPLPVVLSWETYLLPVWAPLLWMIPLAMAEAAFLIVAALRAREDNKVSWAWRAFIVGAVVWAVVVVRWAL